MPNEALVVPMMLRSGLIVAGGGAVVATASFLFARRGGKPLFAPVGPPRSYWNGIAVLVSFVIFAMLAHVVQSVLIKINFFEHVYGPKFPPIPLENAPPPEDMAAAAAIRFLWSGTIAFLLQVGLIVAIVRAQGGPNPISGRMLGMNIASGYLTWLMITPAAYSVFVLANLAHSWLTNNPPDKHPLTLLGDLGGDVEWTLFILQTVFMAPVLEELVFRGVLLPWLSRKHVPEEMTPYTVLPTMRSNVVLFMAFAVAVMLHLDDWRRAIADNDFRNALARMLPGLFFLAIVPLYWVLPKMRRLRKHLRVRSEQQVRAILASSALFAAFHATVWPSPIPLFVLAMGLGYLAIRTRSLVGPILVHGMFNAIGALYLVRGGPA